MSNAGTPSDSEDEGKAGGDPDEPMCPICRVEMKRADQNLESYERVKFKLSEVANELKQQKETVAYLQRENQFLADELDKCREPCPNHKGVLLLPFEGCAVCANST